MENKLNEELLYQKFFKPFYIQNLLVEEAYANYKSNPVYLHASCLKVINSKTLELLQQFSAELPTSFSPLISKLIIHYLIWTAQFDELLEEKKWKLNEEFIFQPIDISGRYPNEAVEQLIAEFNRLKSKIQ